MSESTTTPAGTEGQTSTEKPPWGDDFDAEKAWNLVKGLRSDKETLAKRPVLTPEHQAKLTEFERIEAAAKSDLDRANEDKTRWQTDAEKWRTQAVQSHIAAMATDFADPSDAASALASTNYLDAGGQIDEAAIKRDLKDLLDKKPHWKRLDGAPSGPRVPLPNTAQGSSGGRVAASPADAFGAFLHSKMT